MCFLAIAAMEDIGLHPKPTNDPPVHRPTGTETSGLQHTPPGVYEHLCKEARLNKCVCVCVCADDMHKDGPSKRRSLSVLIEPQMVPQFPPLSVGPLGADTST